MGYLDRLLQKSEKEFLSPKEASIYVLTKLLKDEESYQTVLYNSSVNDTGKGLSDVVLNGVVNGLISDGLITTKSVDKDKSRGRGRPPKLLVLTEAGKQKAKELLVTA